MHVTVDLGLSSLILVVCFVFPAIVFVIRKKWQIAVERDEEVKRLLALLSEETARAEVEAAFSHGGAPASYFSCSTKGLYQCAVCFSQTTTRCSRCKNVRYCSGKCQIIHWRQGHKDNCIPPSTACRDTDGGDSCAQKTLRTDHNDIHDERCNAEASSRQSSSSSCSICSDAPCTDTNNLSERDFVAVAEQEPCALQSAHMDSSGFSSPRVDNEPRDEHESDPSHKTDKASTLSPTTHLIGSVDSCRKHPNLNLAKHQNDHGESRSAPASSSRQCDDGEQRSDEIKVMPHTGISTNFATNKPANRAFKPRGGIIVAEEGGFNCNLSSCAYPHSRSASLMNASDSGKTGSITGLNKSVPKDDHYRGLENARYSNKGGYAALWPYQLWEQVYEKYRESTSKEWCFTCEFENLVLKVKEGKSPVSPAGILSQLHNIARQLGTGSEEDAHEFLRCAVDTMQCVFLKESGVSSLGSFEEETTLMGLTFGGYLLSKIKCLKCQYKSERQERMMDLTVEIGGNVGKLEDALRRFTCTEILDGDNKYRCDICKSYQKAKKKLTILEAPNVLTIALKRFQSGKFGKLNKSIGLPEILDLAPYMSNTSDRSPLYRLYGVVVHLDAMNSVLTGHYVCYIKNFHNKWFQIDDSRVMDAELERVLTTGAYMLLYARCYPRAPSCVKSRYTCIDPKNSGPDKLSSVESFYMKFNRLTRILKDDSSSDGYSFASSNSDESCCSTESTRDSTSTDDLSDVVFGGWGNNTWKMASDSDTTSCSPPSSPLCWRQLCDSAVGSREEECGGAFVRPRRKPASSNCCRNRMVANSKLGGRASPSRNVQFNVSCLL